MASPSASSVLAVFRVVASEFSATSDDDVVAWINLETPRVNSAAYGTDTSEAIALRVAHKLKLEAEEATVGAGGHSVGPGSSIRTGDLAITRSSVLRSSDTNADLFWKSTRYGLQYLALQDEQPQLGFGVFPG